MTGDVWGACTVYSKDVVLKRIRETIERHSDYQHSNR